MKQALDTLPTLPNDPKRTCLEYRAKFARQDSIDNANEAWFWALARSLQHPRNCDRPVGHSYHWEYDGMRRWAYVIWDDEILDSLWVFDKRRVPLIFQAGRRLTWGITIERLTCHIALEGRTPGEKSRPLNLVPVNNRHVEPKHQGRCYVRSSIGEA